MNDYYVNEINKRSLERQGASGLRPFHSSQQLYGIGKIRAYY